MAAEWHYSKEGQQHGPVSASVLKNLVKSGDLLPTDLIWKEGMAEWKPASNVKGLFSATPAAESPKASPASPQVTVLRVESETAKKKTLVEAARGAVQYAAKQTERSKLVNLTLPPLYQALGLHAFSSPDYRAEFAELFQQLDQVQAELSEISGRSPAVAKSLGDKAKAMAGQAMQAAQSQKLSMRQSSLFGTLGKAMFDKHEAASGPQELVKPIADCVARLAMLDTELDALSASKDGTWITPKRLAISVGTAACVFLAILLLRMDRGGILGVSNTEADITISAIDLYTAYKTDAQAADLRFKGKRLAVSGNVGTRDDNPKNVPNTILFGLKGSSEKDEFVACYFTRESERIFHRLDAKPKPPIIGTCQGAAKSEYGKKGARPMEVQLIDCEIPEVPGANTPYDRGFAEGKALGDSYMTKYRSWPKGQKNGMTEVMQNALGKFTENYEAKAKYGSVPSDTDKAHGYVDGFRTAIQDSGVE